MRSRSSSKLYSQALKPSNTATMTRVFLIAGALFGATGVLLGAFGAHGLKARLTPEALSSWDTAVTYQLFHALALLFAGLFAGLLAKSAVYPAIGVAGTSWIVGILLFSGSIYVLAIGGPRFFGPITPLGGLALIVGWAALLVAAVRQA